MSHPSRADGFTLIEVLVTISLMSVMMAIAIGAWASWTKANAESGTAKEIQSVMRQAQQRAVTEGTATCVLFSTSTDSYSVYTGGCADAGKVRVAGPTKAGSGVHLTSPGFSLSGGGSSTGATFYGRGTGSPGDVTITRNGSSKTYLLSVDWLTGRVSIS